MSDELNRAEADGRLRPLNVLRDLPAVADLVELCFRDTMDADGERYLQQLRRASRDHAFLRWANRVVDSVSMPLSGYVWEQDGRVIGNASLIPFNGPGYRIYLIANVAVHPDFRRQGLGRILTQAAVRHAAGRQATATWLQVRADNPGAVALYRQLDFVERARRTTWQAPADRTCAVPPGILITSRRSAGWPQARAWLDRAYPPDLEWYFPMPVRSLGPGFWPALYRLLVDYEVRQYAAQRDGVVAAVLAWRPFFGRSDRLWIACPAGTDGQALTALLLFARRSAASGTNLTTDFPAGEQDGAIQAAGFTPLRTLLWMQLAASSA